MYDLENLIRRCSVIEGNYYNKLFHVFRSSINLFDMFQSQKKTSTSLTVQWKDDDYNRNANITHYELILK